MKTKLLALIFLAGGAMFAQTRFSVGVNIGGGPRYYAPGPGYYAPRSVYVPAPVLVRPAYPGPGFFWVNGYRANHRFVPGYWKRQAHGHFRGGSRNYYRNHHRNR